MSDPKLDEAVRIVRVVIEKLQMAGDAHLNISAIDALEAVLAALEAAGAWQADRAAVCADRERLSAQLAEAQREPYRLLWKALEDAGVTRGDGCPDTILWEEIHRGRRAEATLAEVQGSKPGLPTVGVPQHRQSLLTAPLRAGPGRGRRGRS